MPKCNAFLEQRRSVDDSEALLVVTASRQSSETGVSSGKARVPEGEVKDGGG